MRALHGTAAAPPSSMFFSGFRPPPLPNVLSFFPSHAQRSPPESFVFMLAFSWSQKPTKMVNPKVRWELHEDGVIVLATDRMWDCVEAGCFLAACQLTAAALQHANVSVARETRRAPTATQPREHHVCTFFPFPFWLKMLNEMILLSCPARSITQSSGPLSETGASARRSVAHNATTWAQSLNGFPNKNLAYITGDQAQ